MDISLKIPFYAKAALIFISVFAFVFSIQIGQRIIIPIAYATIIAILLNPLVNYMTRNGINKIISISIIVIFAICVVLAVIYIITSQLSMFGETYPQLKQKLNVISTELVEWTSEKFKINKSKINAWISNVQTDAINNLAITEKLTEAGRIIVVGALLPVYLFMILYYKPLLMEFIRRLFRSEHHLAVTEVLTNSKIIIQSYLIGLFFELIIISVLNSAGLLLLGIDYAIILGIIGAFLNIIPYIGGIIAIALPMIIAFVTKDSPIYSLLVFFIYILIQFIDNHYIIPKIVASRVKINALISVIVVLIGGALCGIPGMFLSIPLTAILKVIFDHIEPLKPWGFLLGNIVPTDTKFSFTEQKITQTDNTQ
jgi:predicted PurR-regulated permease PerM